MVRQLRFVYQIFQSIQLHFLVPSKLDLLLPQSIHYIHQVLINLILNTNRYLNSDKLYRVLNTEIRIQIFVFNLEEMARQIIDSNAETIIGTIENYQVLKNIQDIIKKPLKFICIKTQSGEKIPSKIIDFRELTNPTSN